MCPEPHSHRRRLTRLSLLFAALLLARPAAADELRAAGIGPDANSARAAALAALSRQVLAQVTSRFESRTRVEGDRVSHRGTERVRVDAQAMFKGLDFTPPRPDGDAVQVEVRLGAEALRQTAAYLHGRLMGDFAAAPPVVLTERLQHARLLDALLTVPAARVVPERERIRTDVRAATVETRRLLDMGRLRFTGPADGVVEVQARPVIMGETVFVEPGTVAFRASRPGHHPLQGRVRVAAGERRVVPLAFIVVRPRPALAVEYPSDRHGALAVDALTRALTPYGIEVRMLAPGESSPLRRCRITLNDAVSAVGAFHRNRLTLGLTVVEGDRAVVALDAHADYTANRTTGDSARRRNVRRLAEALGPRLVVSIDALADDN